MGPEERGPPPWELECPPPDEGTGASPSSAMRDRYSLSMRALSWADWGGSPPVALWAAKVLNGQNGIKTNIKTWTKTFLTPSQNLARHVMCT